MKTMPLRQSRLTPKLRLWSLSTGCAKFENTPNEIWHAICEHADRLSLFVIRRVCHRLADIAAHYLFKDLYIVWLPRSIERLVAVASHPRLRYHLKTLFFEQELLREELATFDGWKELTDAECVLYRQEDLDEGKGSERREAMLKLRRHLKSWKRLVKDGDLRCIHEMVTRLVKSQQELLAGSESPGMLACLISRLPNLDTIRMVSAASYRYTYNYDFHGEEPDLNDDRWHFARHSLDAELLVGCALDHDDGWRKPLPPVTLVLRAMASAPTRITNLRIFAVPADFWMTGDKPWSYESSVMPTLGNGLLTLRFLNLRLLVDYGNRRMAHFLQSCCNVTHLKLSIHSTAKTRMAEEAQSPDYWGQYPMSDISEVLMPLRLTHLQHVIIDQFSVTEEAFVGFIKTHAETLRSMRFKTPYMTSPDHPTLRISSWEKAIVEVAPFMSLEHVELGMLGDSSLSALLNPEGIICDNGWGNRQKRFCAFASAVAAYLMTRGRGDYPKYEPKSEI